MSSRVLWSDVPDHERRSRSDDAFYGCPYAVRLESWAAGQRGGDGYRHCGSALYRDESTCWNHRLHSPSERAPRAHAHARSVLLESVGLRYGASLAQFRAMDDVEISELRNAGVKTVARLREIRDTWTDEQIAKLTGISLQKLAPPSPPAMLSCCHVAPISWLGG